MSEKLVGYGSAISMLFTIVFVLASVGKNFALKGVDKYKSYRAEVIGGGC